MTYMPKVGDLFHFKGDTYDPDEDTYTYEEDVGILVSYNSENQEGRIYWLRFPDPDTESRVDHFYFGSINHDLITRHAAPVGSS